MSGFHVMPRRYRDETGRMITKTRKMRFEEPYGGRQSGCLTQEQAARFLGICESTFRRYIDRNENESLEGLIDKRLNQVSHRRAPLDEVMWLVDGYRSRSIESILKPPNKSKNPDMTQS
jgi:hypothetical protein